MPYLAMVLLIVSILCALVGFADTGTGRDTAVARALALVGGVSFLVVVVLAAVRGRGNAAQERDEA